MNGFLDKNGGIFKFYFENYGHLGVFNGMSPK